MCFGLTVYVHRDQAKRAEQASSWMVLASAAILPSSTHSTSSEHSMLRLPRVSWNFLLEMTPEGSILASARFRFTWQLCMNFLTSSSRWELAVQVGQSLSRAFRMDFTISRVFSLKSSQQTKSVCTSSMRYLASSWALSLGREKGGKESRCCTSRMLMYSASHSPFLGSASKRALTLLKGKLLLTSLSLTNSTSQLIWSRLILRFFWACQWCFLSAFCGTLLPYENTPSGQVRCECWLTVRYCYPKQFMSFWALRVLRAEGEGVWCCYFASGRKRVLEFPLLLLVLCSNSWVVSVWFLLSQAIIPLRYVFSFSSSAILLSFAFSTSPIASPCSLSPTRILS